MLEQGDLFPMSLDHKFQTSGKIHVAAQKMSKSGFFQNDRESRFSLIVKQRFKKHEFQADYDRRSTQKLNEMIESQKEELHRAQEEERRRQDHQLLHEQLLKQNWDLREAHEESLYEMEELKRFQGSTFDTISRRKLVEDQDTILELTGKTQELPYEINCMNDSRDFQDAESVRSGHSHVTSQLVFFPPHPHPGGMLSRSFGMPSRNSLVEQKAQREDRFLRGKQIAYLIYEYFWVTGASASVENYADLFTIGLRNDDIQEFDSKWDGILLSMTKIPSDDILERLYKLKIRESEKLKTILELYDLEIHQKKAGPEYHRLKTMVKRSIEQDLRNRNLGARNGNYERKAVVKNQGTKQRGQRILGDCWQWKANGQCSKGDNCSFRHDINKRAKSAQPNPSPSSSTRQNERVRREPEVQEAEV